MNVRRSRSAPPRPQTTNPASLSLRASTAGWYAEWKARKQQATAAPTPEPGPEAQTPPPADAASEALTRWLTGGQ